MGYIIVVSFVVISIITLLSYYGWFFPLYGSLIISTMLAACTILM